MNAIDQLCTKCGLCCDGTLFADVELRAGDNASRLAKLGLTIEKKGRSKTAFAQPCTCFDGKLCAIYADRPKRCRWFECGLLKKVQAGEMRTGAALKKISQAKSLAKKVQGLLSAADEGAALSERYARGMSEPVDLSQGANRHGKLIRAYEGLMEIVQRDFLR